MTDLSIRIVPIGENRDELLASRQRTRDYLTSLHGSRVVIALYKAIMAFSFSRGKHMSLSIPVFDADNHLYETKESLTKFLPDRYKNAIDYVEVRGRTKIVVRGTISNYIPNPTFDVVARPGAMEEYYRVGNPEGKDRRAIFGEPMQAIPAFREPAARLALMDEQGLDRTLMFPTLASLIEERMRDDPDMTAAVVHALNEWIYETWQFNYADRIYSTPVITLGPRRQGDRGTGVGRRARRQGRAGSSGAGVGLPRAAFVRACPSSTRSGRRSSSTTSSSRCTRRTPATSATRMTGWATTREFLPFQPQAFRMLSQWRPIEDAVSALVCHGALSRFPDVEGRGDRERQQLGRAAAEEHERPLQEDAAGLRLRIRSRSSSATSTCRRSGRKTWSRSPSMIGEDHVLFGSDFPHPEGLADPVQLRRRSFRGAGGDRAQDHGRQPRAVDERRGHGSSMTIPALLAATAERDPSHVAVVDGDVTLTYGELLAAARGLPAAIAPGSRVAIWAPNSWKWIVAVLGLWEAGATLVPINTRFKDAEASVILERSGATLLTVRLFGTDYAAMVADVDMAKLPRLAGMGRPNPVSATSWRRFR